MHVEHKVRLLLQRYQTNCPFALARHLRLHVRFKPLPRHIRGFYCRISGQRFIVIDEALPFAWKRFVCAHELGHDQLHRGMSYYYYYYYNE
ncbi:MAG: ImmA/IrrE family metallo-endopeptidase, partial [Alicyclobacillaceae bacterium]|nr:ImmA/IrrE family metallo-endopeptidase [Alicyclobacillaceae bacterium]